MFVGIGAVFTGLENVDYLEGFPTVYFKRLFALVLIGLAFLLLRS